MPHYPHCCSAILQIFLCCVYFGKCCQMLTIWTLSSFFKSCIAVLSGRCIHARVLWCEERHHHLGDLVCPTDMPTLQRWGVQKWGQSAGFTFVLLSLSTRTGNAPKVSWFLSGEGLHWAADHWRFLIEKRWWWQQNDHLCPYLSLTDDEGWNTWEGEPGF